MKRKVVTVDCETSDDRTKFMVVKVVRQVAEKKGEVVSNVPERIKVYEGGSYSEYLAAKQAAEAEMYA